MYNKHDTEKILDSCNTRIVDVIGDFHTVSERNGKYTSDCPKCGKVGGLTITPDKKIYKCFHCKQVTGHTAVDYLMDIEGKTFPDALEYLQHKFSIVVDIPSETKIKPLSKKELKKTATYLDRMLLESGLTPADIKSQVIKIEKNCTGTSSNIFYSGSVSRGFEMLKGVGDDVLIEYYDLKGDPCKYELKVNNSYTGKFKEFFRVRYQVPENNLDKQGKPVKYRSPYGSGNFLYIPEKIRELYRTGKKIDRLFLQEGEKKAEKACKHEIWSVGIAGIQNIAMDGKLPKDLITIIKEMEVKEVILLFDADWNDISNNLKLTDQVDQRPKNFYYAARNFRDYMRSLKNMNISVEVLIGHVNQNAKHNKGIDDLLADTLKGQENKLKEDIETLINEKNLKGEYLQLFKIAGMPDMKLEELWNLNNPIAFAKLHQDTLKHLKEFKIGKHLWRFNDQGEVESAQPIESDEQFWEVYTKTNKDGQSKTMCEFIYENNLIFLQNRYFGRYKSPDGQVKFVQLQHPVVKVIDHYYIRDYVKDFIRNLGYKYVLEMLHRGGPQYLGPDKLSDLNYIVPIFEKPELDKQRFYFRNYVWETTERGTKQLEYPEITYNIWDEEKHDDFDAKLIDTPLINVFKDSEGEFDCTITDLGRKCQFLQFLVNVSNFTWRKEREITKEKEDGIKPEDITITIEPAEIRENHVHLVSKLCAIGYMLLSAKDRSISRAVVAMDGKQSEVGQSNGRTGKSLLGEMFKAITPSISINGKKDDLERDTFLWDELSEKTKIVFMDDVRTNFNLEFLFTNITGDWAVNYKGGRRTTFPFNKSPKIYITTNHALNGTGGSFLDRQYLIAFSDWYSDTHKPVDDFGCQLFSESWGFDQWNLHWNLMAYCVQIYLKYGVIQAPQERIAVRQMRQQMGETFLAWADEYFSDQNKLNIELIKKNVWDEYMKSTSSNPKYDTITVFKKRMKAFCQWKGYTYNPHMYDKISGLPLRYDKDQQPIEDDKRGGIEYIQIGTNELNAMPAMMVTEGNEVKPATDDKPF